MAKTLKEIADDAERRWTRKGYTEKQKEARRRLGTLVITSKRKPSSIHVNNHPVVQRRLELDRVVDEMREQRRHREVWDE